ncbi:MAG: thioredoxin family protein [Sporolactobacillus sp.]
MKMIETEDMFKKMISTTEPIIVKFETSWCPDCKRLNQYVDDLVQAFPFQWYAVDRDQLPKLAERYDVLGIPSLLAFKKSEKIAHLRADNKSPEEIRDFLAALAKPADPIL